MTYHLKLTTSENEKDKNNISKKPDRQTRASEINVAGFGFE